MDAIIALNLSKKYDDNFALQDLNLRVDQGERFAMVGEAGCGKSTALRLFAGLATPSSGECTVMGFSPVFEAQKVHATTGVVTETAKLYNYLSIRDNLSFFGGMQGVDSYDAVDRISFLLHGLDIWEYRDKLPAELPTSAIQKANLARALIHYPQLLLLDEPTNGMNIVTLEVINSMITKLAAQTGMTTFLSTRFYSHAQQLCDQYAIMENGSLRATGDLETLRRRCGLSYRAVFKLAPQDTPPEEFSQEGDSWTKMISDEGEMPKLIDRLYNANCSIYEAAIVKPSLKDIYHGLNNYDIEYDEDYEIEEMEFFADNIEVRQENSEDREEAEAGQAIGAEHESEEQLESEFEERDGVQSEEAIDE